MVVVMAMVMTLPAARHFRYNPRFVLLESNHRHKFQKFTTEIKGQNDALMTVQS